MIHIRKKTSRRNLLRGLGASAALVPLLDQSEARGHGEDGFPCRVVIVMKTNGVIRQHFYPEGKGTDLTALALPAMTEPLLPYLDKLTFVGDLEMRNFTDYPGYGGGHENYSCTFTGVRGYEIPNPEPTSGNRFTGGGPSVDQYIAEQLGNVTPIRTLNLGVRVEEKAWYQSRCFYTAENQWITPQNDPHQAFNTVFAGVDPDGANNAGLALRAARRQSILDHVGSDLESFASRLGTDDRNKVLGHLQAVRELEMQVGDSDLSACTIPTLGAHDIDQNDDYPEILQAQLDVIVNAFKCDRTRIATIQLTNGNGSNMVWSWLGISGQGQEFGIRDDHDVAHRPGDMDQDKIAVERWYMQQLAALMDQLDSVPEGSGTMLDNTIILWANHMGNGAAHSSNELPWILAGGGAGYLKTGQRLSTDGAPTNGVLRALCEAMGVDPAGFGDPVYGDAIAALRADG